MKDYPVEINKIEVRPKDGWVVYPEDMYALMQAIELFHQNLTDVECEILFTDVLPTDKKPKVEEDIKFFMQEGEVLERPNNYELGEYVRSKYLTYRNGQ